MDDIQRANAEPIPTESGWHLPRNATLPKRSDSRPRDIGWTCVCVTDRCRECARRMREMDSKEDT